MQLPALGPIHCIQPSALGVICWSPSVSNRWKRPRKKSSRCCSELPSVAATNSAIVICVRFGSTQGARWGDTCTSNAVDAKQQSQQCLHGDAARRSPPAKPPPSLTRPSPSTSAAATSWCSSSCRQRRGKGRNCWEPSNALERRKMRVPCGGTMPCSPSSLQLDLTWHSPITRCPASPRMCAPLRSRLSPTCPAAAAPPSAPRLSGCPTCLCGEEGRGVHGCLLQ